MSPEVKQLKEIIENSDNIVIVKIVDMTNKKDLYIANSN